MRNVLCFLALSLCLQSAVNARAEDGLPKKAGIPVYVTPYYDFEKGVLDVGPYSKELAAASPDSIGELTQKMTKEWDTLSVEAMYVTAIRLYDLGHKDDAVYWYYSAQWRARVFAVIVPADVIGGVGSPAFERMQAHAAFQELAGDYINGYAFGDVPKLLKTLERVKSEGKKLPRYEAMYPRQEFISTEFWGEKNKEIAIGFETFCRQIVDSAEEIKTLRRLNGMDGKF